MTSKRHAISGLTLPIGTPAQIDDPIIECVCIDLFAAAPTLFHGPGMKARTLPQHFQCPFVRILHGVFQVPIVHLQRDRE